MMNFEKNKENKYVKDSKDNSSYNFQKEMGCDGELSSTSDCLNLLDDFGLDDFGGELEDFNDKGILDSFDDLDCLDSHEALENLNDSEISKTNDNNSSLKNDGINANSLNEMINPFIEENPDELAMLGFFNDFRLVEMGMGDFIREVYFEDDLL